MTEQPTPQAVRTVEEMRGDILNAMAGQDAEAALIAMIDALTVVIVTASGEDKQKAIGMTAVIALEIRRTLTEKWNPQIKRKLIVPAETVQ